MQPINNHTKLNSSLYSYLSSGAVDVIMADYPEGVHREYGPSENNPPQKIDKNKENNIYIGDRYTIFLGDLFTNTYLINLEYLGIGKSVFIQFRTSKQWSFSLDRDGNNNLPYNIKWRGSEKWGLSKIQNLKDFFESDELRDFLVVIHKINSYTYSAEIIESDIIVDTLLYIGNNESQLHIGNITKDYKESDLSKNYFKIFKCWNSEWDGSGVDIQVGEISNYDKIYPKWEY